MTRELSAETMMPGPCIFCGLTNYPLSAGGPMICPSCDCGDFGLTKVERQRKEIEQLQIENNDRVTKLLAQIVAMRDEIERLGEAFPVRAENVRLRAEVARLRAADGRKQGQIEYAAEIERLTKGLQMLAKQEYDAGYTPEGFAEAILSGDEPRPEEDKP